MTDQRYEQDFPEASVTGDEHDPEAERIVTEIEATRSDMGATIDEIGHRLQPETIANEAREKIKEATVGKVERLVDDAGQTAQQTGTTLVETIKRNPVPAALAGLGLGWLALRMRDQGSNGSSSGSRYYGGRSGYGYGYGDRYSASGGDPMTRARSVADDAVGRAQDVGATVQQAAQSAADTAQQTVQEAQWQAQHVARDAQTQFDRTLNENPLALGALAVGVGAAVALAIPSTRREQELMGEQRDRLVEKASEVAGQAMDEVQVKAQEVSEEMRSGS